MNTIPTLRDLEITGKCVIMRVDFNVPLNNGKVTDTTRIDAALPTLEFCIEAGAKLILLSHLGRPTPGDEQGNAKYSLAPVAEVLAEKLGQNVAFANNCVGETAEAAVGALQNGEVLLLENVRYHAGETANDATFAAELAKLGEVYVNDAFGTAHRAHASTEGIAKLMPLRACGFLMERELEYMQGKLANPARPFAVVLGGAKVSDKITVIDALLDKCDTMLIGGAMAYTFALAMGKTVGDSLVETDKVHLAEAAIAKAKEKGVQLILPEDTLVTDNFDFGAGTFGETKVVAGDIPEGWEGVDIGPETSQRFSAILRDAKTIVWNGPMGVFEIEEASRGTFAVAADVATGGALTIVGGGDSVKAINQSGFADKVSFISTGGGASLELLEGKALPGVVALQGSNVGA